jgi:hypothetical protein
VETHQSVDVGDCRKAGIDRAMCRRRRHAAERDTDEGAEQGTRPFDASLRPRRAILRRERRVRLPRPQAVLMA